MAIRDITEFWERNKRNYIERKINEYISQGVSKQKAINKANQSWRAFIGHKLQELIFNFVKEGLIDENVNVISDYLLNSDNLSEELLKVKQNIEIAYNGFKFLPDADIIIYKVCKDENVKVLAIISVKNSFRERGFETTYWRLKLKLLSKTRNIKFFLVTPDKDNEIAFKYNKFGKPLKMRIILEKELDGIYFLKENFQRTSKAKKITALIDDLKQLIQNNKC